MIIGIDHGFYAIKTRNCSFPAGITPFGDREPYTRQNVLTFGGCFFCLRQRAAAHSAGQNCQRQLLPADAGRHRQRTQSPRRAPRV